MCWHPSGEVLVSTSYDDSIKLWVDAGDEWVCAQTLSGALQLSSKDARQNLARCMIFLAFSFGRI